MSALRETQAGQLCSADLALKKRHPRRGQGNHPVSAQIAADLVRVAVAVIPDDINDVALRTRLFLPVDLLLTPTIRLPRRIPLEHGDPVVSIARHGDPAIELTHSGRRCRTSIFWEYEIVGSC